MEVHFRLVTGRIRGLYQKRGRAVKVAVEEMARPVKLSKPSCPPKFRTLVIPGLSLDSVKEKRG